MQAGLISRVAPAAELEETAQRWASDIASFNHAGLMYSKKIMHRILKVLPRDQRLELNTLGNQEMRAAGRVLREIAPDLLTLLALGADVEHSGAA